MKLRLLEEQLFRRHISIGWNIGIINPYKTAYFILNYINRSVDTAFLKYFKNTVIIDFLSV